MSKRFVHFTTKAAFNAATLGNEYDTNSIVFIKDSLEIWTHGLFYAIPDSYKERIEDLETAKENDFAIRRVSDGLHEFIAASGKQTVTFAHDNKTSVTVDGATGTVTIGSTIDTDSFYPASSGAALSNRVNTLEGAAVLTITGEKAIEVTGTGTSRTAKLKLDPTATNVTLSLTASGLKAAVTNVDTLVPVDGVAAGDKVLTLTNKKIGSTLKLSVDTTIGSDGKKYIRLTGANNADLGKIDTAQFVKDGMLSNASFNEANNTLTLTFNTDSGKTAIPVDLSSLVDTYDGSNLKLKTITVPTTYTQPATGNSVDSAIANLIKKDTDLAALISNVNTTAGDALNSISGGKDGFVTTTVSAKTNKTQKVSVTVKSDIAPANATETNNSLATSYAVKQYVEDMLSWEEL